MTMSLRKNTPAHKGAMLGPKGVAAKIGWKEGRGCQEPEWRETQRKQGRVWAARRLQKLGVDRERDLAEPELH